MIPVMIRFFTFALIALFLGSRAFARKVENWPCERLLKESDLVMIGSIQGWRTAKAEWPEKIFDKARFKGEKTAFHPRSVLKGEPAFPCIWVLHFSYKKGALPYEDGPGLVTFLKKPVIIEVKSKEEGKSKELQLKRTGNSLVSPPEYLLFLKQREDGNYEPVSGQLDAALSIRALFPSNHIKIP
tara:strand:- start:422 stop:976 length:555 start_codon:yes stop_codon:yes gene_type:complete